MVVTQLYLGNFLPGRLDWGRVCLAESLGDVVALIYTYVLLFMAVIINLPH